jgi:inosine-uridine nucleoside N-ribohydrolase
LIWIGGPEYSDIALPPPGYSKVEYNLNIDPKAAMAVFNKTAVKLANSKKCISSGAVSLFAFGD